MSKYVIFGGGGHASSIYDLLMNTDNAEVSFCADSYPPDFPSQFDRKELNQVLGEPHRYLFVLGLGAMDKRLEALDKLLKLELNFPSIIHPKAYVSKSSTLGSGTIVFANSYIGPNVTLGKFMIANTNSVIEHGSRIDDFSILAPSVTIAGNVNIGSRTFIGMSSSVSENLEIGSDCIVGANSFVNSSLENGNTYYGTPARKVR